MPVVMDVRSIVRATLIALTFFWMATSLPHMYSTTKSFFLESLPSILSAAMAPKCLFVFSNVIVVFLVGESKLSRRRGKPLNTSSMSPATGNSLLPAEGKEKEVMAVTQALLLTFTREDNQEQENNIHEDKGGSVLNEALNMVGRCEKEADSLYLHHIYEVLGEVEENGEGELELMLGEELRGEEEQECTGMQELQETDLPAADELNRRVEDFIARFNMERQLEAKMLVTCY